MFTVYILRTTSNTLYTGITTNLVKRLKEHQERSGRGAKYTRAFGAEKIMYVEEYATRSEALKREHQIKKLTRDKKEQLCRK